MSSRRNLILRNIRAGSLDVDQSLESNWLDSQLGSVVAKQFLGIVRAIEWSAIAGETGAGVVSSDNEVSRTIISSYNGVPERLPWPSHTHRQWEKG